MPSRTNSTATIPLPYRHRYGAPVLQLFQESTVVGGAATNTIRVGDVVQMDVNVATANHRIVKASSAANVPNVVSTALLGIAVAVPFDPASTATATAPGSTDQSRMVMVCVATPQQEFLWPTKSSAVVSSVFGTRRAIAYDSTLNMFYADIANSTAGDASLVVTAIDDPGGSSNNPVACRFISTNTHRVVSAAF